CRRPGDRPVQAARSGNFARFVFKAEPVAAAGRYGDGLREQLARFGLAPGEADAEAGRRGARGSDGRGGGHPPIESVEQGGGAKIRVCEDRTSSGIELRIRDQASLAKRVPSFEILRLIEKDEHERNVLRLGELCQAAGRGRGGAGVVVRKQKGKIARENRPARGHVAQNTARDVGESPAEIVKRRLVAISHFERA